MFYTLLSREEDPPQKKKKSREEDLNPNVSIEISKMLFGMKKIISQLLSSIFL